MEILKEQLANEEGDTLESLTHEICILRDDVENHQKILKDLFIIKGWEKSAEPYALANNPSSKGAYGLGYTDCLENIKNNIPKHYQPKDKENNGAEGIKRID